MTPNTVQRAKEIFSAALSKSGAERAAVLDDGCGDDDALRALVEKLLDANDRAGGFLTSPEELLGAETAASLAFEPGPSMPQKIGRYHVKRVIAAGGMGVVYEAVQEHPHRTVALKVMKAGIASRSALRRFEYESQILARLRHPNIAQVYEAGTHDDGRSDPPLLRHGVHPQRQGDHRIRA